MVSIVPTELWIWKFVAVAAGGGVTVGCIMLVSAIRCNQLRTGKNSICLAHEVRIYFYMVFI